MFIIEETEISKAIDRARDLHPTVRMVRFGWHEVTGSWGNTYAVRYWREKGRKVVDCACPPQDGVACKHAMAAVPLHSFTATTTLAQRA